MPELLRLFLSDSFALCNFRTSACRALGKAQATVCSLIAKTQQRGGSFLSENITSFKEGPLTNDCWLTGLSRCKSKESRHLRPIRSGLTVQCASTMSQTMLRGRATGAGTQEYAKRFEGKAGPNHFRKLVLPGTSEELYLSSLGVGTYLGPDTDEADEEYEAAVEKALDEGVNVLDSAINYRNMRSERMLGQALARKVKSGSIRREEVVLCSKGGFLAFDKERPRYVGKYIEDAFVKTGVMEWSEFIAGCHCMAPKYMTNQIDRSLSNFNVETIDLYYLHNPETQLSEISREEFKDRIRAAFGALEEACKAGKIGVYGAATWTGFRVGPDAKEHLSLEEFVGIAKEVGGENHHFRVIQVPFNMSMQEAAMQHTQNLKGRQVSLLEAAKELGIYVVASASLMQAKLSRGRPAHLRQVGGELPEGSTDAQLALQYVRTTPGIGTGLVGMRQLEHAGENVAVIAHSSACREKP